MGEEPLDLTTNGPNCNIQTTRLIGLLRLVSASIQERRGNLLWRFILSLLSEPELYGHMVIWTSESDRTFQVVNVAALAQAWVHLKNGPNYPVASLLRALK